jgi:hypothetical protein
MLEVQGAFSRGRQHMEDWIHLPAGLCNYGIK